MSDAFKLENRRMALTIRGVDRLMTINRGFERRLNGRPGGATLCRWLAILCLGLIPWQIGGCAVHYFDPATGTEHIWGFGHMQMKVAPANEGVQAVVRGTDVLGLSVGSADQQAYLTLGWHRVQRLDVITESTAIRLEWPSSDFAEVRVGTEFPYTLKGIDSTEDRNPSENRPADARKESKQ